MPKVRGKVQLCTCDKYETCFKSFQGIEGTSYSLFDRYSDIENVVNRNVDEKYRHFLAQPEIDGDTVFWFSMPYRDEAPRRLTDLPDEERRKYEKIENDTLNHYHNVVQQLKQQGKNSEAECLEKAIKYVNDDFIYCYDGKTVLGIWGMQLRENIREPLGVAVKNATFKTPRPQEPSEPEPSAANPPPGPNEEKTEKTDMKDEPEPADEPEKRFDVRFNAGRHGGLNGQTQYSKSAGDTVKADEVPEAVPDEGWRFAGWDKEPVNHTVAGDVEFTALYEEIRAREEAVIADETTSAGNGMGSGCGWLNWLLLPLLLALIFMVIWCCLLDKCNVCLCCGAHGNQTTVVADDTLPPNHGPIPEPVKPCDEQMRSGGDEGYAGVFDMGQPSGTFVFEYNTYTAKDEITIYEGETLNGKVIFHYPMGGTETPRTAKIKFNSQRITVKVIGSNGTAWNFKVNCPN